MPEGVNSIEDLKVVITGSTEKFGESIVEAQNLVQQFGDKSGISMGMLDGALAKSGNAVAAFKAKLGPMFQVIEAGLRMIQEKKGALESLATQAGLGEEFKEIDTALNSLGATLSKALTINTKAAGDAVEKLKDSALEYGKELAINIVSSQKQAQATKETTEAADGAAKAVQKVTDEVKEQSEAVEEAAPKVADAGQKIMGMGLDVEKVVEQLEPLGETAEKAAPEVEDVGKAAEKTSVASKEAVPAVKTLGDWLADLAKKAATPGAALEELRKGIVDLIKETQQLAEERLLPDAERDLDSFRRELSRTNEALAEHQRALRRVREERRLGEMDPNATDGITSRMRRNIEVTAEAEVAALEKRKKDLLAKVWETKEEVEKYAFQEEWEVTDTYADATDELVKQIDRQIDAEKAKVAGLKLGIHATKEQIEVTTGLVKLRQAAARDDEELSETDIKRAREKLAELGRLKDHEVALQKAREAAKKAERDEVRTDKMIFSLEREIENVRKKADQYTMTAGAAARLHFEENALLRLQQQGLPVTEAAVLRIKSLGAEMERQTDAVRSMERAMEAFKGTTDIVARSGEQAFSQWWEKGKVDWKKMIDSMIADLLRLQLRLMVMKPLMEGLNMAGGGLFKSLGLGGGSGGWETTVIPEMRAAGGPVGAGERGPELFVPNVSGMILPNSGGGAASGPAMQSAPVTVNIQSPPGTTARETRRRDSGGGLTLDIVIEQIEAAIGQGISEGRSKIGDAVQNRYGLAPAAR